MGDGGISDCALALGLGRVGRPGEPPSSRVVFIVIAHFIISILSHLGGLRFHSRGHTRVRLPRHLLSFPFLLTELCLHLSYIFCKEDLMASETALELELLLDIVEHCDRPVFPVDPSPLLPEHAIIERLDMSGAVVIQIVLHG